MLTYILYLVAMVIAVYLAYTQGYANGIHRGRCQAIEEEIIRLNNHKEEVHNDYMVNPYDNKKAHSGGVCGGASTEETGSYVIHM